MTPEPAAGEHPGDGEAGGQHDGGGEGGHARREESDGEDVVHGPVASSSMTVPPTAANRATAGMSFMARWPGKRAGAPAR